MQWIECRPTNRLTSKDGQGEKSQQRNCIEHRYDETPNAPLVVDCGYGLCFHPFEWILDIKLWLSKSGSTAKDFTSAVHHSICTYTAEDGSAVELSSAKKHFASEPGNGQLAHNNTRNVYCPAGRISVSAMAAIAHISGPTVMGPRIHIYRGNHFRLP